MTVVRELITKLGFQVDRSGLGVMERAIQGFRSRVVFTGSSIKDFAFQAAAYLGDIAKANVDVAELARNTGTSVERFVALREAAKQFRFEPSQFDHTFSRLSDLLSEAKKGYGEVYKIALKSYGQLNLIPFAQTGDVEGALNAVLRYVESLETAKERIAVLREVIGGGAENGLLRVIEGSIDKFNKAAESNINYAQSFDSGIKAQKEFLSNMNELIRVFNIGTQAFANFATPIANFTVENTVKGLKGLSQFHNNALEGKGSETRKVVGQSIADVIYRAIGIEPLIDLQNRIQQEDANFYRAINDYQKMQRTNNAPTTVNNRVEVLVAPGTDVDQRTKIAEAVRDEMEAFYDEKNREVISNNPQVE